MRLESTGEKAEQQGQKIRQKKDNSVCLTGACKGYAFTSKIQHMQTGGIMSEVGAHRTRPCES